MFQKEETKGYHLKKNHVTNVEYVRMSLNATSHVKIPEITPTWNARKNVMVSVLLSALVERFSVTRLQDFK